MSDVPAWLAPILTFTAGLLGALAALRNGAAQRLLVPAQRRQLDANAELTRLDALDQATQMWERAMQRVGELSVRVQQLEGRVKELETFCANVHYSAPRVGVDVSPTGVLSIEPGTSVLIVDDDPDIVLSLQQLLHTEGYSAMTATTVDDAVALAQQHSFAVAIIDLYLGQPTALDLVTALRSIPALRSLQIIVCTAARSEEAQTQRLIATIDPGAVISKPWQAEHVLVVLRTLLSKREMGA